MGSSLLTIQLHQRLCVLLLIIFIIICVSTTPTISTNSSSSTNVALKKQGLTLNLIHRDLIHPPIKDNIISQSAYEEITTIGSLKSGVSSFYVSFQIGSEKVLQYASLDTGSRFLWVRCVGPETARPVYDPSKSTSYKQSTCRGSEERYCKKVPGGGCDGHDRCKYSIKYVDGVYSKGVIGFETLTFYKPGLRAPSSIVSDVLFGCGMDNRNGDKNEDGVFGIGGIIELSILEKTGKKFSFCFGNISNKNYEFSHLALGNDAKLTGYPVPFTSPKPKGFEYRVNLQRIIIGTHEIELKNPLSVVIDSGATQSYLRGDIQKQISDIVEKIIGKRMVKKKLKQLPNVLCYKAASSTLVKPFPLMNLVLGPHTEIQLDVDELFHRTPMKNVFCLTFRPSNRLNLIGATALQYHNVGFDLRTKQAYFTRIVHCESML